MYVVFDGGFTYSSGTYPNGIGATADYNAVTFVDISNGGVSVNFEDGVSVLELCSQQSNPEVCINMRLSKESFSYEGRNISSDQTKFDLKVNNIVYPAGHDSFGLRTLAISQSFDATIDITVPDDGSGHPVDSEMFGAAYFEYDTSVLASTTSINSVSQGGVQTKTVRQNKQTAGVNGANCGYGSSSWYNQPIRTPQASFENVASFFSSMGLNDLECLLFNFQAADNTLTNFFWDPVIGIDKSAAEQLAMRQQNQNSDSGSDGISAGAIAGIVVGCLVVVVLVIGVVMFVGRSKK